MLMSTKLGEKSNIPESGNPKVVTESDREVSAKEAKEMKAEAKEDAKERRKPKEYSVDTFKRPLTKDEKEVFNDLDKDEKRKFIIKRWVEENRQLDKKDMHEISLADEQEIGLRPNPGPQS